MEPNRRMCLKRPLAFFDLETTGVDLMKDRVIDVCVMRRDTAGVETIFSTLVNPGRPIPAEATSVHHITDEMVRDAPTFEAVASRLLEAFRDADLSGFNIAGFDVPLLGAEFKRVGIDWPAPGTRVIDQHLIFKRLVPHSLASALGLYCSRKHVDAHRAEADVLACADVLDGQVRFHQDLPADADELAAWCATKEPGFVDFDGKLRWKNGEATFAFGKVQDQTLRNVAKHDPGFLRWVLGKDFSAEMKQIASDALAGKFPVPPKE